MQSILNDLQMLLGGDYMNFRPLGSTPALCLRVRPPVEPQSLPTVGSRITRKSVSKLFARGWGHAWTNRACEFNNWRSRRCETLPKNLPSLDCNVGKVNEVGVLFGGPRSFGFKSSTLWPLCEDAAPLLLACCWPKEQTTKHKTNNKGHTLKALNTTLQSNVNDTLIQYPTPFSKDIYSRFKPPDCAPASALVRARSAPRDRALVPPEPAFAAQQPDDISVHHSSPVRPSELLHGYWSCARDAAAAEQTPPLRTRRCPCCSVYIQTWVLDTALRGQYSTRSSPSLLLFADAGLVGLDYRHFCPVQVAGVQEQIVWTRLYPTDQRWVKLRLRLECGATRKSGQSIAHGHTDKFSMWSRTQILFQPWQTHSHAICMFTFSLMHFDTNSAPTIARRFFLSLFVAFCARMRSSLVYWGPYSLKPGKSRRLLTALTHFRELFEPFNQS